LFAVVRGPPGEAVNTPAPLLSRIDRLAAPKLSTTRSVSPSPSKSPAAMPRGPAPVAGVPPFVKVPLPLLSRIETVLVLLLVTAMSSLWSPLKSATATATGRVPTGMGDPVVFEKAALPLLSITETLFDM
jgi:hypothetical protein